MTRRPRDLTPQGREALEQAQAATDQVRDARALMNRLAAARRDAVLRANAGGASYATIAKALGVSTGNVQQIMIAARAPRRQALTAGEFDDPRYSDGRDREDDDDRSPGPGAADGTAGPRPAPGGDGDGWLGDAWHASGADYVAGLLAVTDARIDAGALDALLPSLGARWPEPRALWQTGEFWLRDGTRVDVPGLGQDSARRLLAVLEGLGPALHAVAARDEDLTTSSGLRRAMAAVGVPRVADLDPQAWLESTALVRALRRRAAPGPPGG